MIPKPTQSSSDYPSVLSPVDAEAVQGKDRMNPLTKEGLHRINVFVNNFLSKGSLNPHYTIADLRTRLNHLNLNFPFDNNYQVAPTNTFEVTHGEIFGATPNTNLMVGFDRGEDLPKYTLNVNVIKDENGFKLEGSLTPKDQKVQEAYDYKTKSNKRVKKVKEMIKSKKKK